MGCNRQQLAADAIKLFDAYSQAKVELESIEELAQVSDRESISHSAQLTAIAAPETYSCQSERSVEKISKAYYKSRQGSIFLPAQ